MRLYRIHETMHPRRDRRQRRLRIVLTILAIAISVLATYGIEWLVDAFDALG